MPAARPRCATSDGRCRTTDVHGRSIARRRGRRGGGRRRTPSPEPQPERNVTRFVAAPDCATRRRPRPAGDPASVTTRRRAATDSAAPLGRPACERRSSDDADRPRSPDVATPRYGRPGSTVKPRAASPSPGTIQRSRPVDRAPSVAPESRGAASPRGGEASAPPRAGGRRRRRAEPRGERAVPRGEGSTPAPADGARRCEVGMSKSAGPALARPRGNPTRASRREHDADELVVSEPWPTTSSASLGMPASSRSS